MSGVNVEIRAGYEGLKGGFSQAREYMRGAVDGMKSELKTMSEEAKADSKSYESTWEQIANVVQSRSKGINGAIAGIRTAWAQLAVVVGAGLAMKHAIDDTVAMTVETQKLGRQLNISATEANAWRIAIGDVYGSTDEFVGLASAMNRQIKNNEDGLKAMGLQLRDSSGEYRNQNDIVLDALKLLNQYKAGTDRNLAAQQMFGRGVQVTSEMLQLNAEKIEDAKKKAESLSEVMGVESIESTNKYRAAMNDAGDVVEAMKIAVGNALMPVLTELANFFAEIGPAAIVVIKGAIGGLAAIFHGLAFAVSSAFALIKAQFLTLGDMASGLGRMLSAAFSGDFEGVKAAWGDMLGAAKNNYSAAMDSIAAKAADTREKLWNLFANGTPDAGGGSGDKSFEGGDDGKKKKNKEAADAAKAALKEAQRLRKEAFDFEMETLRSELDAWKNNYDERIRIAREMSEAVKKQFGEQSDEYKKSLRAIANLEREKQQQMREVMQVEKDMRQEAALAGVDAQEQAADLEVALDQMTVSQRIAIAANFEDQRFEILRSALEERLQLMQADPDMNPVEFARLKADIENLELQHQQKIREIKGQFAAQARSSSDGMFSSIEGAWGSALQGMLTKQTTTAQGLRNIWKGLYTTFLQEMVTKPLAAMGMRMIRESAIGKAMAAMQTALQRSASGQIMSQKSTETSSVVASNAAQAGSGAASSQASIPYIGPILALAAMAAIFGAVMALGGGGGSSTTTTSSVVPSAAGGFDIPAGVNPLTQLHEQEMVLPKDQANVIRDMAGGSGGGGDVFHLNISALDGADVKRVLMQNKGAVADALKGAIRDFKR
jgi:hypothetical protein